ncbi:Transposase, Mutator family [Gordonia westfalica]|uniref:Transposase, Mutator family n=1 Tax=Gordonia westfalica TaxID=158898 RepID=Q70K73_9ACTN|nr:putative transposase [Gordonia westfalica]SDT93236.1 Transposase, Mutator family [Gordonia westfalica]
MTDTIGGVDAPVAGPVQTGQEHDVTTADAVRELSKAEQALVSDLVRSSRAQGVALTGPDGLLKALTKSVLEAALDEEMTEHLGYDKHDVAGRNTGNSRNGTRTKRVLTDACGQVPIEVPRDRNGTFDPVIVGKSKRRVTDVDRVVLSLYAKGLTTGEISAHFADVYGASVSKDTISRITDRVIEEMVGWWARPLEKVYAAVFIDAIMVKIRDGQVRNRPIYAAIGVDLDGHKDILGMWAGNGGGESARFWLAVLTDLKNRGVRDIFFVVCDGLKGLPDSVSAAFPLATVQTCIIHLIRNTFKYASRKYWDKISADLKPIYTASTAAEARLRWEEFAERWGTPYPAIVTLWESAWEEFIPFLDYDVEIRRVLCSTNAIESLNARYRRAVRARGHFPNEQSALKTLYLVTRSLDPKGTGQTKWAVRSEASAQRPGNHVRRSYARSRRTLTRRAIGKPPLTPNIGQTPLRPRQLHRLAGAQSYGATEEADECQIHRGVGLAVRWPSMVAHPVTQSRSVGLSRTRRVLKAEWVSGSVAGWRDGPRGSVLR